MRTALRGGDVAHSPEDVMGIVAKLPAATISVTSNLRLQGIEQGKVQQPLDWKTISLPSYCESSG